MVNKDSLNMSGYSIDDLYVGQKGSISKTITETDVYTYAGIIGDFNPLHVNAEYAKNTRFGERIAHGMLTASFFSTVVGMLIPGTGGIYLGQSVRFVKPVKIGDTITAEGIITEINKEKKIITVETTAYNQRGEAVVTGEAKMMVTL
ncbi:MAG: MaoC family dehydratase [Firmicutes bacterium]|nr:MaoC family dehydratase [Bacillota bacterium]